MRAREGVTLIELLIAIALLSIVGIFLANIFYAHTSVFNSQRSQMAADISSRFVLDEMSERIREGKNILSSAVVDGQTYNTGNQTIALEIPSLDISGNTLTSFSDTLVFNFSSPKIIEIISPNAQSSRKYQKSVLSSSITDLNISYDDPDYSKASVVEISVASLDRSQNFEKRFSDKVSVKLRNKV